MSLDLCLAVESSITAIQKEIEEGHVDRHGALGKMKSIYLRDPDGNLIELCSYQS